MSARVAVNVKLEVQSTIGSALPITVATLANPVVVTSAGHGLADGDYVLFVVTDGIVQLDGVLARVANKTTDTWEVEGVNGTAFSAIVSGATNAYKVTAFSTLSNATNITMPDGAAAKEDATTLLDVRKKYLYGLPDAPDGSINTLYGPAITAVTLIKTASRTQARIAMRLTWAGGQKTCFVANVSGGEGFTAAVNQVVTANIAFTPCGQIVEYAS